MKGSRPTGDVESYYYYDKAGRLEMVDAPSGVTRYSYNQDGTRAAQVLPNGVRTSYSYDNLNRTTLIDHKNPLGTTISSFAYDVGRTGKRLGVAEDNGGANATWDYTYDGLGRLTYAEREVGSATKAWEYDYDLVGNRYKQTISDAVIANATTYTYNPLDQLVTDTTNGQTNTYTYDGNGNLTHRSGRDPEISYFFDSRNRLRQVYQGAVQPNNLWLEYAYDVAQNRVAKAVRSGGTITGTGFLIDDNNLTGYTQALMEFDLNTGTPERRYDYADDLLTQVNTPTDPALATPYFFQYDALGSTRSLTSDSSSQSEEYAYEPFGTPLNSTSIPLTQMAFTGQHRDGNINLQYHRARWLETATGRWGSVDPILDFPANYGHRYIYVGENPINGVDLSGATSNLDMLSALRTVATLVRTHFTIANTLKQVVTRIIFTAVLSAMSSFVMTYQIAPLSGFFERLAKMLAIIDMNRAAILRAWAANLRQVIVNGVAWFPFSLILSQVLIAPIILNLWRLNRAVGIYLAALVALAEGLNGAYSWGEFGISFQLHSSLVNFVQSAVLWDQTAYVTVPANHLLDAVQGDKSINIGRSLVELAKGFYQYGTVRDAWLFIRTSNLHAIFYYSKAGGLQITLHP